MYKMNSPTIHLLSFHMYLIMIDHNLVFSWVCHVVTSHRASPQGTAARPAYHTTVAPRRASALHDESVHPFSYY